MALLPNVLVCNPALPVQTTAQFVAFDRSRNGQTNMASAGIGSVSHPAGAALQAAAGFKSLLVPYKGGSQGVQSVVSGEAFRAYVAHDIEANRKAVAAAGVQPE